MEKVEEITTRTPIFENCGDDSKQEAELTCNDQDTPEERSKHGGTEEYPCHAIVSSACQESSATSSTTTTMATATRGTLQTKTEGTSAEDCNGDSLRERLKRHRTEVAGRVWIPDTWGQENLLKDLIDCAAFNSCLASSSAVMSARASLIEEGRRTNSTRLKIEIVS